MIPRLLFRPAAPGSYALSLELLGRAAERGGPITKSGFMIGFGEQRDEILSLLDDLFRCFLLEPHHRPIPAAHAAHRPVE